MKALLRRLMLALQGHRLICTGCEKTVVLPTEGFGSVLVFDESLQGWTFRSERGWHCPICTEVLST